MRTNLNSARLQEEGLVATTHTTWITAKQEAAAAESLVAKNLISPFDAEHEAGGGAGVRDAAPHREGAARAHVGDGRLADRGAGVAGRAPQVDRGSSGRCACASLQVRALDAGIVQDLTLQPGQWVTEGTTLAKVVQPGKLKAVIRIPETQAKDVQLGQPAEIDTRNGIVHGKVARKDPSSVNGTVTVDVSLDGALPPGAVPDLSVDGTIKIAQLKDVMFTGRPAYGSGTGQVGLFKVVDGGSAAVRVQVALGKSSVTTVEILRGLSVGDKVILSDMSQYDNVDRVRLK